MKRRRNNEMLDLQNRISEEDNAEFIGRRVSVLVEGPSKSAAKRAAREGQPADGIGLLPIAAQHDHSHEHSEHHAHHDEEPRTIQHASPEAARLAMQLTGRSEGDRIVVFDGNPRLVGTNAEIEIQD